MVGIFPLSAAQTNNPQAVTQKEVSEFRMQHEPEWKSRFTPGSRLFYHESEWPGVLARVRALEGPGRKLRELAFDNANKIIEQPLPVYRAPASCVGPGVSVGQSHEELWQRPVGNTIVFLAFMARLDNNPKYKTYLRDLVLTALRFDTWGSDEWRDADLAAASIVRGVAITWDWHRDIFDDNQKAFIRETMARRVSSLHQMIYRNEFWGNQYRANHNHIGAAALGLAGLAFFEDIPEAGNWLSATLLDYERIALAGNADGSSEEGLSYWSYGMNFILQFIEGTRTVTDSATLYSAPFLKNAAAYRLACSTPGFGGVLTWGDSVGKDFYGPHQILYRLASQYHDESAQFLANQLPFIPYGSVPAGKNSNDVLAFTLLWLDPSVGMKTPEQLDYHLTDWDVITSRSGWANDDYLVTIKSGLNVAHHSHTDAGSLAFNMGGKWLLTTPEYGEHGGEGYWDSAGKRWTFFSNATESHSTLLLNGKNQRFDAAAGGVVSRMIGNSRTMFAEVDLTKAYDGVESMTRRVLHRRGDYVLVLDDIQAAGNVHAEWLAQVPPAATVQDGAIVIAADSLASLRIQLLGTAPTFVDRQPTTPNFNIPSDRLKTLTAGQDGNHPRFAALLRPVLPGKPYAPWKTSVKEYKGKQTVRIDGNDWVDVIEIYGTPGRAADLGDTHVHGIGNALAVRKNKSGAFDSLVVLGALQLNCPVVSFRSEKPVNVAVESGPNNSFVLDLVGCLEGEIHTKPGYRLIGKDGNPIPNGKGSRLENGHYILQISTETAPPKGNP